MLARAPRVPLALALAFGTTLGTTPLVACSSSPSQPADGGEATSSCVSAPSCPSTGAPSYKAVIVPILQQDCIACHSPGGPAGYDESTYAQVASQASAMLSQVVTCAMPPLNGPQLDDAQRVALTAWLKCGAPNN